MVDDEPDQRFLLRRTFERTLNSVSITDRGLVVGNELEGVTGRLGWSALRTHDPLEPVRRVAQSPAGPS